MTTGSQELALTIINDGAGYQRRRHIANYPQDRGAQVRYVAQQWVEEACDGTRDYLSSFTVEDILLAAVELERYYAAHVKE